MIPFSMENESVGSPNIFHCRMSTCSPRVELREKLLLQGMPLLRHILTHSSVCCCRNADVNAPRYATTPADINTSPVRFSYCIPRSSAALLQRVFSPPKPPISFSALSSFLEQAYHLLSKIRLLASVLLKLPLELSQLVLYLLQVSTLGIQRLEKERERNNEFVRWFRR